MGHRLRPAKIQQGGRMKVIVNGSETEVPRGATVAALLERLDLPGAGRGVAVAVEAEVVPRTEWERHALDEGDRIEVLRAIQGG
jgi:sulfur carrier protein